MLVAAGVCAGLMVQSASADALKSVLSKKLHTEESMPGMVNLDALNAPKPVKPKSRSPKAVVAVANGHKITKKEADAYLSKRTKGKVSDFDLLPKKQRIALIKEMSLPTLLSAMAKKEISKEEKSTVLSRAWMGKKMKEVKVSDAELEAAYNKLKAEAKAKSALEQIPPYETIKERLKMQIAQQRVLGDLMKGASIRVADGTDGVAGYVGMMAIGLDEVNKALEVMTKGKMTWDTLPQQDKIKVLQMVAPRQYIALAAENGLSTKEKQAALENYWMQKRISQIDVSEKEVKRRYEKLKKMQKSAKKRKKLPDYATLKQSLKMQIANEKLVEQILKKANIKLK